jgi:hypothetical protein
MWVGYLEYLCTAGIGLAVGLIEIVGRYRDNPWRALQSRSAFAYMIMNGTAALLALYFLEIWRPEWIFGAAGAPIGTKERVTAVLVAGLGAVTLLRSSFLKLKSPDGEIPIGPSVILDTLLRAVDRQVDRTMANDRAVLVSRIMKDISFERAKAGLPAYCFALMQNVPIEEQLRLFSEINKNAAAAIDDRIKSFNLGLGLLTIVGADVLQRAVDDTREQIRTDLPLSDQPASTVEQLVANVDYDRARSVLPSYCASIRALPPEAAKKVADQVAAIDAAGVENKVKTLMLGMTLVQTFGHDVLELAIRDIGNDLRALTVDQQPARRVARLMEGVDYARARSSLVAFCLSLRPLPEDAQKRIAAEVTRIDASTFADEVKCLLLGMLLIQATGLPVLELAVASLGAAIKTSSASSAPAEPKTP